ncbi:glucosaminidase domain-containing protein [Mucilaginibacter sp.]|jgi:LysM repeat protein|uniref:glucosaminidase domain-containing protein n=1 Tax=Mucilaginibacter sp. TaxID=1882438 RepID=UPI002B5C6A0A|nr:glucosaminidase domain-containing protein [Mucilaginibacter sp.]HTI59978.1 glucosaminidase domain-containing protein [Mucilaginibacter sp.]
MQKIFYPSILFIAGVFLSSCSVHKDLISNREARRNNQQVQKDNSEAIASYRSMTSLEYIDRYKTVAIQEMNLYGIPASITLAQGLFESGSGNSELARVANNHFGIKCNSQWQGKTYYKDDDNHNDCFRVYNNAEDSYRDHSEFLKRPRYANLFKLDKNDYAGWANGLKAAGYATNPNYPQLLINVIQKYNLDQYDLPETPVQKEQREDRVLPQIEANAIAALKDTVAKMTITDTPVDSNTQNKTYTVAQGDTLYSISRRFGLTVDQLKSLNNLPGNNIKIGQKLVVGK